MNPPFTKSAFFLLLMSSITHAEVSIATWKLNPGKFAENGGANTISLRGKLMEAVNLCSEAQESIPIDPVIVKHGDRTESITFTNTDELFNEAGLVSGSASTGNTNWDRIINTADWSSKMSSTLLLGSLTDGNTYQVELFLFDNRIPEIGSRKQTVKLGQTYSPAVRWDQGNSLICTFTASGTSQALDFSTVNASLSAYILRDVTATPPEPGILGSMASYSINLSNPRVPNLTLKQGWGGVNPKGDRIAVNPHYITYNDKPWMMMVGEFHPVRYPVKYWEEQILKMKAGGLNTISLYTFWSSHEEEEGVFTWTDQRNIRLFVELCAKHDMFVFLRIGPYCNGEYIYGGLPPFLKEKGIKFRSNDPVYLDYVRKFYNELGKQMNGLMFKDGGPIVAVQLENEFQHAPSSWGFVGEGGEEHMMNLKHLAIKAGFDSPIFVCTAWGGVPVPKDEFLPGTGGYAFMGQGNVSTYYTFYDAALENPPNHDPLRTPLSSIEIGPGMLNMGRWRPVAPPESAEAIALVMLANGNNNLGYYMYQGGTHFVGKNGITNAGGRLNYDWHCPLRDFGNRREVYDFLKPVNYFVSDFGDILAPTTTVIPSDPVTTNTDTGRLRFAARAKGESGFLFLNNYQDRIKMPAHKDLSIDLKFAGSTMRVPHEGGFDLNPLQSAIIPFNLDLEGVILNYAMAQLYTRTQTIDGRNVYVFFVPDGFDGSYAFNPATVATVNSKAVAENGKGPLIVIPEAGTSGLIDIQSKSGKRFQILSLTRAQAMQSTRQEIFGRQRLVLSSNLAISESGKLRVSEIGESKLAFSVYPPPETALAIGTGELVTTEDGAFRHYRIELPEVKPEISIEGIGSSELLIRAKPSILDGISDVFLFVDYLGDQAEMRHKGELLCDDLFDRTGWQIGLKRFRDKLDDDPLLLKVSPPEPIIEVIDNLEVNSGVAELTGRKGDLLVGTYEESNKGAAKVAGVGQISSVSIRPEYAVWISAATNSSK